MKKNQFSFLEIKKYLKNKGFVISKKKVEKKKAIVNYGIFTTNVNLDALEKVS